MSTDLNIKKFMQGFSAETTPGAAAKIPDFREHLRPGTVVYITFLPGSDFKDTVTVAARLREEGFIPVPHFAARSIKNKITLDDHLHRICGEAGIERVLCIAGAVDHPVGEFSDSTQLLESGLFDKHNIKKIALAGHPEGSPDMTDEAISAALKWKNDFAAKTDAQMYLVTQFVFEAGPIIAWDKMLRSEGNALPIHIGVPGLATLKTLLMHATHCGIGASMQFLTKQAKQVTKLMRVNAPDKLVTNLADYVANDPESAITGVHIYPLGGLKKSAAWSYAVSDGHFSMNTSGNTSGGFNLTVDIA